MAVQEWREHGKCNDLTPEESDAIFFFGPGKRATKARAFCGTCPVQRECLNNAILFQEEGVWAGTTDEERGALGFIRDMLLQDEIARMHEFSKSLDAYIRAPNLQVVEEVVYIEIDYLDRIEFGVDSIPDLGVEPLIINPGVNNGFGNL